MKPKLILICPECKEEFRLIKEFSEMTGVQWDRYAKGSFSLYECPCGSRHWDYKKAN